MSVATTWHAEFYHPRRGTVARYAVEASRPADAVVIAWKLVLAEHPAPTVRKAPGLFERAQRIEGQHVSGWILYRIWNDSAPTTTSVAAA